jgi:hypothetical protein
MVRKTISCAVTILMAASLIWAANDPWKSKPYQQWDDKDLRRIFNESPWAKVVQTSSSSTSSPEPAGMPAEPSSAGPGQQTRGMGGGGGQYPQPSSPSPTSQPQQSASTQYVVRWVSSRTIREAAIRSAELKGQLKPDDAAKDLAQTVDTYQVLVAGPNMKAFQGADETTLKNGTVLEMKKTKGKLAPSEVKIDRGSDGSIQSVVFLFPKKSANGEPSIGTDEKGADFLTRVAGAKINVSFDFSKMEDSQGRDL